MGRFGRNWVPIRRGVMDHVQDGLMTPGEHHAFLSMLLLLNHSTSRWRGSAAALTNILGYVSADPMERAIEGLEAKGYILRSFTPGGRGNYTILIGKFEVSDGLFKGKWVDIEATKRKYGIPEGHLSRMKRKPLLAAFSAACSNPVWASADDDRVECEPNEDEDTVECGCMSGRMRDVSTLKKQEVRSKTEDVQSVGTYGSDEVAGADCEPGEGEPEPVIPEEEKIVLPIPSDAEQESLMRVVGRSTQPTPTTPLTSVQPSSAAVKPARAVKSAEPVKTAAPLPAEMAAVLSRYLAAGIPSEPDPETPEAIQLMTLLYGYLGRPSLWLEDETHLHAPVQALLPLAKKADFTRVRDVMHWVFEVEEPTAIWTGWASKITQGKGNSAQYFVDKFSKELEPNFLAWEATQKKKRGKKSPAAKKADVPQLTEDEIRQATEKWAADLGLPSLDQQ